ncbi:MAG: peptide chain release factor 1 [Acetobacteraceae bacterium]|nr:peptide chain release factor 1 [Acetobacteraceae bacterium]
MSDQDHMTKLDQLERLLNDPDVPMEPGLIWSLLDEIMQKAELMTDAVSQPG